MQLVFSFVSLQAPGQILASECMFDCSTEGHFMQEKDQRCFHKGINRRGVHRQPLPSVLLKTEPSSLQWRCGACRRMSPCPLHRPRSPITAARAAHTLMPFRNLRTQRDRSQTVLNDVCNPCCFHGQNIQVLHKYNKRK